MKIKAIVSLLVTLAMIASTLTVTVGAGDSDGCGGLGVTDDEIYPFGDIIKEVWDTNTQDWADVTVAEINDTVRFRITVVYCETDHEDAFSVRNITVNDTLPDCLEYADNANIIPDYQSGKTIIWEFAGPYYSNDEGYCVVATIEFDAKVVDYTSENGEFNLVQVIGLEKCSSRNLYGEDIATVIVYEPQCGEIVLDKKVWDGQTWVDNAVVGLGPVTFNITVTYFAGCGTEATDIVVRDYLYPAGDVEWTYSSDYDSNFAPSIANISFIQWNLTEDFGVVLYDGQSVSIEFTITLVAGDGSIENCAEVDAFEHCCGCDLCDADCATVTIECIPEIVVEKQVWADGEWSEYLDQVYLNETVSFKIDIYYYDCGSDYEILNLIVEDELPCCLEYLETTSITSTGEMDDPTIELVDNYNIYWNWTYDRHVVLHDGDSITIMFEAKVFQYCPDIDDNWVFVWAWGCSGPTFYGEDNATVDCRPPEPEFYKLAKIIGENDVYRDEINVTQGDMLSFALVLRYYGEEPLETIQFTDIMPCILEYRDNVHVYHSNGSNYTEITDKFTVELSSDGKTIWFTQNGSLLVKDSETIGVVFDVEVVGVTGTCEECGEVFNYGCVSGRIGCTKEPNFFMEDYLQINSGCPTGNCPPSIPSIRGPTTGVVGEELTFYFITDDPDGDQVYYKTQFSDESIITDLWLGPYASGNEISQMHTFSEAGTYTIKAKAKDTEDHESGWTPVGYEHVVTIVSQGEPCIEIDPESHDFGTMEPGLTDSTVFKIWNDNTGTLTYSLSESSDWLELSATSGESTGEKDNITININTTGLSEQMHTCNIQITSNGGDEVFTVTVNVAEESPEPQLSIIPPSLLNIDYVEATIENVGDVDVPNVDWEINITGGLLGLVTIENSGTITYLGAGGSEIVSSNEPVVADGMLPFGLGPISGTIKASAGDHSIEEPVSGFIVGKFIIIMSYAPS